MIANILSIADATSSLHVSASQIKTFLMCPEKYRHNYVLRTPPSHKPSGLAFGSAIHQSLAAFYNELKDTGKPMPRGDLLNVFRATWEVQANDDDILYGDNESYEGLEQMGTALLSAAYDRHLTFPIVAEVLDVEAPFAISIPGSDEVMVGTFDLVGVTADGETVIVEHKTTGRRYSEDQLRWDLQPTIYSWAAQELGLPNPKILYHLLLKTKKPAIAVDLVERSRSDIDEMFRIIDGVLKAIDAEAYWPNRGWACTGCQYGGACGE